MTATELHRAIWDGVISVLNEQGLDLKYDLVEDIKRDVCYNMGLSIEEIEILDAGSFCVLCTCLRCRDCPLAIYYGGASCANPRNPYGDLRESIRRIVNTELGESIRVGGLKKAVELATEIRDVPLPEAYSKGLITLIEEAECREEERLNAAADNNKEESDE